MIKNIHPVSACMHLPSADYQLDYYGKAIANIENTIYFVATDGTTGYELWKTDGTSAGTSLVKDIYTGSDQIVLHLHWQGKLIYSSTQLQVSEVVGSLFGKLLSQLDEKLGGKATFNILVHSMGGFVLQHLLKEAKISNKINECIMAAPDVETEAFIQSDYFGIDPKKILVLTCKDDKTLALANFMNPYPRLGVSGHLLEEHSIPHYEISDFSEDDLLVGKIMKHRYFYTNQKIRTFIAEQFEKC